MYFITIKGLSWYFSNEMHVLLISVTENGPKQTELLQSKKNRQHNGQRNYEHFRIQITDAQFQGITYYQEKRTPSTYTPGNNPPTRGVVT